MDVSNTGAVASASTGGARVLVPLAAVGVGSFAFHATLTLWGQFVDVLPMYAVGCVLLVGALVRLGWVAPRRVAVGGVALLGACAGWCLARHWTGRRLVA